MQSQVASTLAPEHEAGRAHPLATDGAGGLDVEAAYRRFAPRVYRIVFDFTGDGELAADVVQETFLRVFRYRHIFRETRPVWQWLSVIALHTCSNFLRWQAKETRRMQRVAESMRGVRSPEDAWIAKEGEVLWSLPEHYRRVLLLRYVLGLPYSEVARLEGISRDGIDSRLWRARTALREALEAFDPKAAEGRTILDGRIRARMARTAFQPDPRARRP